LDVGCNVQMLKAGILQRKPNCDVIGIDVVDYSILYKDREGKKPDVLASGEFLPFRDSIFDFVSFIESLEHMDSKLAIEETFRVLKKGGRVFIQSVHKDDPAFKADPTHVTALDEKYLNELLRGFTKKEIKRVGGTLVVKAIK